MGLIKGEPRQGSHRGACREDSMRIRELNPIYIYMYINRKYKDKYVNHEVLVWGWDGQQNSLVR